MKIASHIGILLAVSTALGLGLLALLFQGAVSVIEADGELATGNVDLKEAQGLREALESFSLTTDLALSLPNTFLAVEAGKQAKQIQNRLKGGESLPLAGRFGRERDLIRESTASVAGLLEGMIHLEDADRMTELGLLEDEIDRELTILVTRCDEFVAKVEGGREQRLAMAQQERESLRFKGITASLLYICLVILLWRWTTKTVIDPLQELTAEAAKAEEGREEIAPLSGGPREVRVLGRTISGLVQSLGQHHEVLEETVKTRTQELVRANEDLLEEIVQRERAEEALKQHEEKKREDHKMEAIGRLAGGVAHDFNNLLTAILGYSDLSLGRMQPEDPEYENLQQIRLAGERAAVLTRQLLLLGRKQISVPVSLSLGAVASNMQKILQSMVGEKISLSLDIESNLPAIEAEQGQVEQVLVNLVVNARDAIDGFGDVKIRIGASGGPSHDGQFVHLFVEDDGEGMEKETQARMFEPYFSTKPADKGTGLGLSIVYGILQQSGGHLEVESAPGEGTTMKLFFPASDKVPVNLEPESEVDLESQEKKRILLVEDEEVVRSLASSTLQFAGYEVTEACDGADAVEVFTGHSGEFDLVVTDVVMPKMGGRELMQTVASSHPEMKVLYMSGHIADEELQNEIVKDGVPFLSKPFKPSELTKKVLEVLDES